MDPSGLQSLVFSSTSAELQYQGSWDKFALMGQDTYLVSTSVNGSTVSLPFKGNAVRIIGQVPPGNGLVLVNYTIDNDIPKSTRLQDSVEGPNHVLFDSPILNDGDHNIDIDVFCTGLGRNYTIQYFKVLSPRAYKEVSLRSLRPLQALAGIFGVLLAFIISTIAILARRMKSLGIDYRPLFMTESKYLKEKKLVASPYTTTAQTGFFSVNDGNGQKITGIGVAETNSTSQTSNPTGNPFLDVSQTSIQEPDALSFSSEATLAATDSMHYPDVKVFPEMRNGSSSP